MTEPGDMLARSRHAGRVQHDIFDTSRYQGIQYNSLVLTGDEVSDKFDPDATYDPTLAYMFFPYAKEQSGAVDAPTVVAVGSFDKKRDIQRGRELVLGLTIGAAALARVSDRLDLGPPGMIAAIDLCRQTSAPLAMVQFMRSKQHARVPQGTPVAALHYVYLTKPRPSLRQLQHGLRSIVADEIAMFDELR